MKSRGTDVWFYFIYSGWLAWKLYNIFSSSSYPVAWQNDQLNAESSHILGHGPMCLEKEISEWVGTTLERGPRLKTGCPYSKCRDTQWQAFMRNYCGTRLGASFSRQLSAAQSTESPEWQWQGLNHYFTIQTPSWGWLVAVRVGCQICQQQRTTTAWLDRLL